MDGGGYPSFDGTMMVAAHCFHEGGECMNMQEMSRLIIGLQKLGLTGDEITSFLLWIESGDATHMPNVKKPDPKNQN